MTPGPYESESRWNDPPLENEAVMIESNDDEDRAWDRHGETMSKADANEELEKIRPVQKGRKKKAPSKWQKNLSSTLSTWYPASWRSGSAEGNNTSISDDETIENSTNNTSLHASGETNSTLNYTLGNSLDTPPGPSLYRSAPRIAKCTISFSYNPVYERALRTHDAHNQLHNYPLYINREPILDDVWTKPAWILEILLHELARPAAERLEWLFWMDADTVLLNPHIPIAAFLPPESGGFEDVHLVVAHDFNGLNNGVFALRVCRWSVQLLLAVLAFPHYRPEHFLLFRDQSAMEELLKEPRFARHSVTAPQRWFNAYQGEHNETLAPFQVRRGDFLVHFAGVGDREQRMRYWLDRAEQHLPDWEIEYKQTSYPTEARDFWAEVAAEREARTKRLENVKARVKDMDELVQRRMEEFQDRLSQEEREKLAEERKHVSEVVDKEETKEDPDKIEEALQKLREAARPLNEQAEKARKVLLKEAQDAIFKAQDSTMKYAGTAEVNHELTETDEKLSRLKELVLQSSWKKDDVKESIEELRSAHASLKEKVEVVEEKKKKEEEEEAKAEEEKKTQRQAEEAKGNEAKEKQEKQAEEARKMAEEIDQW
ncbi:MAG: hypothetical protein M1822_000554 [Bathelium mastoideum]|nr:MAG: hypothetical protein M1822_000554 [Bathelium mastoideum]